MPALIIPLSFMIGSIILLFAFVALVLQLTRGNIEIALEVQITKCFNELE